MCRKFVELKIWKKNCYYLFYSPDCFFLALISANKISKFINFKQNLTPKL